jgi:predicted nucleic acid-binding protein
MKIFIDTDICLDVLLNRKDFFEDSAALFDWAENNPGQASVSWHGLANLHYMSECGAEAFIRELLEFCEVPACGSTEIFQALELGFQDFEDALQTVTAMRFGAQMIATRNTRDYRRSPIQALSPQEILRFLL